MRSRRNRQTQEAAELNITAFMNLMVILVPFLLITAVFSRMTVLEINLPALDAAQESSDEPVELQLQVLVGEDHWLVRDGNLGDIRRIEQSDEEKHWETLREVLLEIKRRFPEERGISLLSGPQTPYKTLIATMDKVRSTQQVRAGTLETVELFPDISLGDRPEEPAKTSED